MRKIDDVLGRHSEEPHVRQVHQIYRAVLDGYAHAAHVAHLFGMPGVRRYMENEAAKLDKTYAFRLKAIAMVYGLVRRFKAASPQ